MLARLDKVVNGRDLNVARQWGAGGGSPRRLSVVHVVLSLECGGLERVVIELIRQGTSLGQRIAVLCIERAGELAPEATRLGAKVACLNKASGLRPSTVQAIGRFLASSTPDVVHTHQIGALIYAGPACKYAGIPVVVHTEHGKHYDKTSGRRWLGRISAGFANRFVCVSKDVARAAIAHRVVPLNKIRIIPNGVDADRFSGGAAAGDARAEFGIPSAAPLLGTVARLSEVKRQDLLIRGFAQVRRRFSDAHLLVVGDGPKMTELREMARTLGLVKCVHFAGYQSNPAQYLQAMDVFALTSRSEGMPLGILEAWSAGKPVVGSAVGGIRELIEHGEDGLLFRFPDVSDFVERVCQLLSDQPLRSYLGANALERVRATFTTRRMAETYQHCYSESLAARGG